MSLKDWTPRQAPGQMPLAGARVALEPLNWDVHSEGLFRAVAGPGNEDIWTYMPLGPFTGAAEFRKKFGAVAQHLNWATMVIRSRASGEILGMAGYMRLRETHGSVEVGAVAFGDALKQTAEASEAMYLMAAHVFDALGYRRYEWKCHNENQASKRAATRFGFRFEGVFRNDMVVRGKNRDTAWFAMTDDDWPNVKAGFERWLAPENFAPNGQQKQSLTACRK